MNRFFDELGDRLAQAARARGTVIEAPRLEPAVAQELLELAGVTAHTHERRFAPLACFLAGAAAERLRAAGGGAGPEEVAALIRQVREEIERSTAASQ